MGATRVTETLAIVFKYNETPHTRHQAATPHTKTPSRDKTTSKMDIAFGAVAIVHLLIWAFVLLAWVHPRTAWLNIFVVVPGIYVLHMLPFHVLNTIKQRMHPGTWKQDTEAVSEALVVPALFDRLRDSMGFSFANPLSPQGMLLFGAITSAWVVFRQCRGR